MLSRGSLSIGDEQHDSADDGVNGDAACQVAAVPTVNWEKAMAKYAELAVRAQEQRTALWEREDAFLAQVGQSI
jgi:hypothetical protein